MGAFANNGFQKQSDDLKKLYPHAIISEESYGILNKQDLEINSCNTSPEPFSEHAISYPYWQCLPTKSASFICDNKNKDGTYSKHDSLLFININDSKNIAVYVARRAMEHTDCLLLKKQWNTLTLNEKYVCLLGINAGLDKEPNMNLDKLFDWVIAIVIGFTTVGHLDTLTNWVYRAQARLVYESRASNWGNPSVFKETNIKTSSSKSLSSKSKTTIFKGGTNE